MLSVSMLRERLGDDLSDDLSDEDVRALASKMERVEGPAGTDLLTQGAWNDSLFLVTDGSVTAHVDGGGRRLDLVEIGPGHWFGELAFIEPGPSSATVTSETAFVCFRLRSEVIPELVADHSRAASALLRTLTKEMAERLAHTGAGVLERTKGDEFQLAEVEESPGWFDELVGRLFSRRRAK